MKIYICNSFSLAMLDRNAQRGTPLGYVSVSGDFELATARLPRPVEFPFEFLARWAQAGAEIVSAVGHADTAALFTKILGRPVELNRITLKAESGVLFLVGQYVGPRLPEGVTELPPGAVIEWWIV
jgi:hypothetical protein